MIPKIHPSNFTWEIWRGGTLLDLGIRVNQERFIVTNKGLLKRFALGFSNGESIPCRPKERTFAVIFQKGDILFWTHLTEKEFEKVFKKGQSTILSNHPAPGEEDSLI